jgi:hypothetical protein
MLRANDRRVKGETDFKPFDLMMVCDVGSHFMDPYQLPKEGLARGTTINGVRLMSGIAALAGLLLIWFAAKADRTFLSTLGVILGGIIAIGGIGIIAGLQWLKKYISTSTKKGGLNLDKNFSPEIVEKMFLYFGSTPITVIAGMLKERGASMLTLNNDVFLKRIRQLLYQRFFDPEKCSDREKASHVYDLSFTNDTNRLKNDPMEFAPSREIQLVAEQAFNVGTTLWFDKASMDAGVEPVLISCGQFTTCYNLLVYIHRLKKTEVYRSFSDEVKNRLSETEQQMRRDYELFKADPFWLYNKQCRSFIDSHWKDYKLSDMKLPDNFTGLR